MENSEQSRTWLQGKGVRFLLMSVMIGVCMIPLGLVSSIISDRQGQAFFAERSVADGWGTTQAVVAPQLMIVGKAGEQNQQWQTVALQQADFTVRLDTHMRSRGIYDVPVYEALVTGEVVFDWATVEQTAGVFTTDAIASGNEVVAMLSFDRTTMNPQEITVLIDGVAVEARVLQEQTPQMAVVQLGTLEDLKGVESISYSYRTKGTKEFALGTYTAGTHVSAQLESDWGSPSFLGSFLPNEYVVTDAGFVGEWSFMSNGQGGKEVVVNLYDGIGSYEMVDRSVKYGALFIALTFLTLFLAEIFFAVRVHPVNYVLVGLSLAMFYLLLLALVEWVPFLAAYCAASVLIVALLGIYASAVLHGIGRGVVVSGIVAALYGYLYVTLQLETGSLLLGTILLFVVLAAIMIKTRHVDWYSM